MQQPTTPTEQTVPTTPLVFISHDSRDGELAKAFAKLLSDVSLGMLKSFRSSDKSGVEGLEYGTEWYPSIMEKLNVATDVVCLLTQQSIARPWILYEAGVAKGRLNCQVLGLAIGVPLGQASTGPFAQFQNCADDEESLIGLVCQLARKLPGADPDHEVVRDRVRAFLQTCREIVGTRVQVPQAKLAGSDETSAKLFEEMKVMYREIVLRLDRLSPWRGVSETTPPLDAQDDHDALSPATKLMQSGDTAGAWAAVLAMALHLSRSVHDEVLSIHTYIQAGQMASAHSRYSVLKEKLRERRSVFSHRLARIGTTAARFESLLDQLYSQSIRTGNDG